ncbi:hypothetical protein [Streptomyces sp. NPDC005077]|uniref:hypothetical protein n=1 Tax=Streptomyces sp. NPDC005077 TaxID=3154292 RepID=UPI0033B01A0D
MTETDPAALAAFIGNQRTDFHVPHRLACRVLGGTGKLDWQPRCRQHGVAVFFGAAGEYESLTERQGLIDLVQGC